jgi:hypothetical protein
LPARDRVCGAPAIHAIKEVAMIRAASALILGLLSLPALAADNGFYLGAAVGQSNVKDEDDLSGLTLDSDDTGFKVIAGFRPLDFLAVELNYVDFGKPSDDVLGTNVEVDANGIDAFGVLLFSPVPLFDLYAKAGVISWDAKATAENIGSVDDSGTDFAWGAGAQFRLGSLAIRGEYEKFEVGDIDDVNMLSLGVTWTFL